jgi:hypothetical protein
MALSKSHLSNKHINIKKDNSVIFAAIGIAVFVVVFGIFVTKALVEQASYNQRVIGAKKDALNLAIENTKNVEALELSYISFANESINVLGGVSKSDGPIDGTNPKIVLDSLPSVYDYPALSSSIEKLLVDNGYQIERIGGSEDATLSATNPNSSPDSVTVTTGLVSSELIEIPYPITIASSVDGTQRLLDVFERSIRPFYIETISFSGNDQSLNAKISMKTFFQPGIKFQASSKVVK